MTDLATALAAPGKLESYKGHDVLRTTIAIRNAGDGLSQAMGIDPVELELGSTHYVILKVEVAGHDYVPIKDTDALELKQVLKATDATLASGADVKALVDAQAERILKAREAAAGITRLEFTDGPEDGDEEDEAVALSRQHEAGVHADGVRDGCPQCEEEVRLEAEEEGATVEEIKGRRAKAEGTTE